MHKGHVAAHSSKLIIRDGPLISAVFEQLFDWLGVSPWLTTAWLIVSTAIIME